MVDMAPSLLKNAFRRVRQIRNQALLERAAPSVDAFLVSYPKSGRTWLRYLLSCYFARVADLGFEPDLRSTFRVLPNFDRDKERGLPTYIGRNHQAALPLIAVSHLAFEPRFFTGHPTIILVRDPRDVLVSGYFHETRHKHRFSGSIAEFIEDETYGVPAIIRYHNGWAEGLRGHSALVISYEAMSSDTQATVRQILEFLKLPVDEPAMLAAIESARFSRMQKDEKKTGIPGHDYDRSDTESMRVRKGKVGGFADTLSPAEADRIVQICRSSLNADAKKLMQRGGAIAFD